MEDTTGHTPNRSGGTLRGALRHLVRGISPLVWVGVTLLLVSTVFGPGGYAHQTLQTYMTDRGLSETEATAFSIGLQGGLVLASVVCLLSWVLVAGRARLRRTGGLRAALG